MTRIFEELLYDFFGIILCMVLTRQLILHNLSYDHPRTIPETILKSFHTYFISLTISLLFPTHQHESEKIN
jgi:hypothetical protein